MKRILVAALILTVATVLVMATASAAPSPILDFDLTQGSGTTVVDSANGIVGTTHGTLWSTDPGGLPVLYFDNPIVYWFGDGDYFEIPDHAALDSPQVSLEVMIYPMDCGYYTSIVDRARDGGTWQSNLHMNLAATGYESGTAPQFGITVGGVSKSVIAPEGIPLYAWSHIVGTYDGNDLKLYVDGVLVTTESDVGGPRDTGSNPLYLGHKPTGNAYFNGYMSSFKMYDRALTAEEISAEFTAPPVANANGPYFGDEGDTITLDASGSSDPDGNIDSYEWDLDNDGEYDDATGVTTNVFFGDNGSFIVGLRVTDEIGESDTDTAEVVVNNVAPYVGPITAPSDPIEVGTLIAFSADFADPGILDTHTAEWDWGDGTTSAGTVDEEDGSGTVTGDHAYVEAGIYEVRLTVTDKDGDSGESVYQYIVVYDPDGGFVSGCGWFNSPAGAYTDDGDLAGRATFGFVSKYDHRTGTPEGETEFHFVAASFFKFHSDTYEWLVVAPEHRAMYQGTGTVWVEGEEQGSYNFRLTAIDGDLDGTGEDKFRIRIWDSGGVIYDNEITAGEYDDPTTVIEDGSIIVHTTKWEPK